MKKYNLINTVKFMFCCSFTFICRFSFDKNKVFFGCLTMEDENLDKANCTYNALLINKKTILVG